MVYEVEAFCPGHITAFFQACLRDDPLKSGSRGAGLCTSLGVRTKVRISKSRQKDVQIFLNDEKADAEVTRRAIDLLLGNEPWKVRVLSEVQLPIAQGFGMSAAGAVSTLLALNDALPTHLPRDSILSLAHRAEVECLTGLGDVLPAALGGMDIRIEPGAPPLGVVTRHEVEADLILCVLGPNVPTRHVLRSASKLARISLEGHKCMEEFQRDPTLQNLFRIGRRFAERSGLMTATVKNALDMTGLYGYGTMSMLGNSIVATGRLEELTPLLRHHGTIFRCQVDNKGARLGRV